MNNVAVLQRWLMKYSRLAQNQVQDETSSTAALTMHMCLFVFMLKLTSLC